MTDRHPVPYRGAPPQEDPVELTAAPYSSWDNRAPGTMRVWVRDTP